MLSCLTCLVPYVLSCLICLMFIVFSCLTFILLYVLSSHTLFVLCSCASRASCLICYVLYVLSYLTCSGAIHTNPALCLASFNANITFSSFVFPRFISFFLIYFHLLSFFWKFATVKMRINM